MKTVQLKLNMIEDIQRFYNTFKDLDVTVGSVDKKYTLPIGSLLWLYTLDLTRPVAITLLDPSEEAEKKFDERIKCFK